MTRNLWKRATQVWLGLFALAFVNGALREVAIKRVLQEPWAHHLSALTAVLLFTGYGALVWRRLAIGTYRQAVWIGAWWFSLTVMVETFVLNRWVSKLSWEQILQTYNLARGELWPLVLVWVGLLPAVLRAWLGPVGPLRSNRRSHSEETTARQGLRDHGRRRRHWGGLRRAGAGGARRSR